jgi:hypothetical protein
MPVAYSVLAQSQPRTNVDAAIWSTRVSFGGFPKINTVIFGANPYNRPLFLSGDNAGAVKLSEDGVVWQDSVAVTSQPINALVYAPNYNSAVNSLNFWILGANNGIISTSTDAVTWTSRTSGFGATVPILALAYGEGTYVAAGGAGTLTTSTDGITWVTRNSQVAIGNSILSMTYGADTFVAGTNGVGVTTSDDGFTWTSRSAGFGTTNINAVVFGNGLFVTGDELGRVVTSPNGVTWTSRATIHNIRALTFADGVFFAGGTNGQLSTSTDSITWVTRQSAFNTGLAINGMAFGNNALALVGDGHTVNSAILESVQDVYTVPAASNVVLSSITVTNPTNRDILADVYLRSAACFNVGPWVPKTLTVATTQINSIAFGGQQYITAGNNGQVRTSTDAVTWVERFPLGFGTSNVNAVTVGSSTTNRVVFAVGGVGGRLSVSTDAVVWTSGPSGFGSNNINALTFGLSTFIAGGENGALTTSTDGTTWTARTSGFGFSQIRTLAFGSGLFVAAGDSGTLTTSTNGATWTTRVSQFGTTPIFATTFGNNTYVAGGGSGALSTSTDGTTWVSRPAVATVVNNANITALTFGDNLFVLGTSGAGGARIATSSDGITWTSRRTVAGYTGFRAAGYGNGVYLVGDETGVLALNDKNFVNKPANALVFRQPIKARDVKAFTVGATLSAGDVISVESSVSTTLTFHAFGGRDYA